MRRVAASVTFLVLVAAGCGKSGSTAPTTAGQTTTAGTTTATAPPPVAAPRVTAEKSGFGQRGTEVGWGVVLRNTSKDVDALEVAVGADVLSASGAVLDTDDPGASTIAIPAGSVFYYGGDVLLDPGQKAARIRPHVDVGAGGTAHIELPRVVQLRGSSSDGKLRITGQVVNTLNTELSSFARIGIVLVGQGGKIVGGGYSYPRRNVPPGGRAPIGSVIGDSATDPAVVEQILGSADLGP